MNKIESFTVDHIKLQTGLYVSRKDYLKCDVLTTFDLRLTRPNFEPVMDTAAIHAIEHLGATFLRNNTQWKDLVIYFGPMGCRTGFYLILVGDLKSKDIIELVRNLFEYILKFSGIMPGYSKSECGNYLDSNLDMAKYYANKYLNEVLNGANPERLEY